VPPGVTVATASADLIYKKHKKRAGRK